MILRAYRDTDLFPLLDLWNQALPLDQITRSEFERRVLLDANREPDSLTLAFEKEGGPPVGFVLALVLRYPIENTGLMEHRGFITAFGVHPEHRRGGIGAALLDAAENFCRVRGRREVALAPYTPNYFVPGVDKQNHRDGLAFLQSRGFEEITEAIAMDALIGQFQFDEELREKEHKLANEGITIEPFRRGRMLEYLAFMDEHMPGPWLEDARRNLKEMTQGLFPEEAIMLACHDRRIIGYCQFEGEHFGPFGVADAFQGRGIGTVLLGRTVEAMFRAGHHAAFVLWTGERAAGGVYKRLGFCITRRFAVMRKTLEEKE